MKKYILLLLIVSLSCLVVLEPGDAYGFDHRVAEQNLLKEGWKQALAKKDIVVYTRTFETSKVKEFVAVTNINATTSTLVTILRDLKSYPKWYADCKMTDVLDDKSDSELIYYFEIKVPFPFKNRDLIGHWHMQKDSATNMVTIELKEMPTYIPEKNNKVRMPIANGQWILTPKEDGTTDVWYQFIADPAGNIPAWVVNLLIVDGPFESLSNLKKIIKE